MPGASNVFFSDDLPEASGSNLQLLPGSSPSARCSDAARKELVQLSQPSNSRRRGISFAEQLEHVRVYNKAESIFPSPESARKASASTGSPPASIRSYLVEQDLNTADSPQVTPPLSRYTLKLPFSPLSASSSSPIVPRGILKPIVSQILLTINADHGKWLNKEEARLRVCGKRPRIVARDSFQVAAMRSSGDGPVDLKGKGKERARDESMRGSDEVNGFDGTMEVDGDGKRERDGESDEEEEEIEAEGALMTESLVDIILNGAEDLLSLEEAYITLCLRLKTKFGPETSSDNALSNDEGIRIAIQPIRDEAPAIVRALQRDLARLLGKFPSAERSSSPLERESSPFAHILPLQDVTPTRRQTSSPTPGSSSRSRSGFTEAEVRYRREASGVGQAALKFLALVFNKQQLYSCFSDADLTALLDQVLAIPRTPKMPTPNPKRTYVAAITVLAHIKIPSADVLPCKEKIIRVLESAVADGLGKGNFATGGADIVPTRKPGLIAVANIVSTYPLLFVPHYADLLPAALRDLYHKSPDIRGKAAAVCTAFATAKYGLVSGAADALERSPSAQTKEDWQKMKLLAQRLEISAVSHLKSFVKVPGQAGPTYGRTGERKTEATTIESLFRDTIGSAEGVLWACATYSALISLMGAAYPASGHTSTFTYIMEKALHITTNNTRTIFARTAWSHIIHAYFSAVTTTSLSAENQLIRSSSTFSSGTATEIVERLRLIQYPVDLALKGINAPTSVQKVLTSATEGAPERYAWDRTEKGKRYNWLVTCGSAAADVIYAHTGVALYHQSLPTPTSPPASPTQTQPEVAGATQLERLDVAWDKVVKPILTGLIGVNGIDSLKVIGWQSLHAITSPTSSESTSWSLDRLLSPRYLSGRAFAADAVILVDKSLQGVEDEAIKPSEIPALGAEWVVHRLPELLSLFQEALKGVNGVSRMGVCNWVRTEQGDRVVPVQLVQIWSNLLRALASTRSEGGAGDEAFAQGVQQVVSAIKAIWDLEPEEYLPIGLSGVEGCSQDVELTRLTLLAKLVDTAVEQLGHSALAKTSFAFLGPHYPDLGMGVNARSTAAGVLLFQLLNFSPSTSPLSGPAQIVLDGLVTKLLRIGVATSTASELLGDITNGLPTVFESDEPVQLDIWRALACAWCEFLGNGQVAPAPAVDGQVQPDITGAVLVDLMVAPFRNKAVESAWHSHAGKVDLGAWKGLLEATGRRFRAKAVDSNEGQLDEVARQLMGIFEEYPRTSSSTITVSCLTAMIEEMSSAMSQGHSSHVPVDLLKLVSASLFECYPTPETLGSQTEYHLHPAVNDLVDAFTSLLSAASPSAASQLLDPETTAGLRIWLSDSSQVSSPELITSLDKLYCASLDLLSRAISSGNIAATGHTLDTCIDLFAPRLNCAGSSDVPQRFVQFWRAGFEGVDLDISDDTRGFLLGFMAAVPGTISVQGLAEAEPMDEEESQRRFPHSQAVRAAPSSPIVPASDPMAMDVDQVDVEPEQEAAETMEYEADISTSSVEALVDETVAPIQLGASINLGSDAAAAASPAASAEADGHQRSDDVFGPPAMVAPRKRSRSSKNRALGATQSLPEIPRKRTKRIGGKDHTVIPDSQSESGSGDTEMEEDQAEEVVRKSAAAPPSGIIGRFLTKASSSLGFFSPSRRADEPAAGIEIIPATADKSAVPAPARTSKKRSSTSSSVSSSKSKKARPAMVPSSVGSQSASGSGSGSRSGSGSGSSRSGSRSSRSSSSRSDAVEPAPAAIEEDDDDEEEDELLLSPRSAAKRKAEESMHGGILHKSRLKVASPARPKKKRSAQLVPPQPVLPDSPVHPVPVTQGRYDDAPEDIFGAPALPSDLRPAPNLNASPTRTSQQARVLAMVEEAARAKAAVQSMDFDGVMRLMKAVDELRGAATANLQERAMRERGTRK